MTAVTVSSPAKSAPRRVILVSVAAAILTMVLKFGAYLLTVPSASCRMQPNRR